VENTQETICSKKVSSVSVFYGERVKNSDELAKNEDEEGSKLYRAPITLSI
jgi:hypothetical protein